MSSFPSNCLYHQPPPPHCLLAHLSDSKMVVGSPWLNLSLMSSTRWRWQIAMESWITKNINLQLNSFTFVAFISHTICKRVTNGGDDDDEQQLFAKAISPMKVDGAWKPSSINLYITNQRENCHQSVVGVHQRAWLWNQFHLEKIIVIIASLIYFQLERHPSPSLHHHGRRKSDCTRSMSFQPPTNTHLRLHEENEEVILCEGQMHHYG